MKKYLYPIAFSLLFPIYHCQAQVVYSNWANPNGHYEFTRNPSNPLVCSLGPLTCPIITNPSRTADASLTNYTTIQFPVLSVLSSITGTIDLTSTVSTGYRGGVYLRSSSDLLSLSVIPNIIVELLNGNDVVGTETYASLINLQLMQTVGLFVCADPISRPYNKVRLTINVPIGVGIPLEFFVYYAYGNNELECLNGALPANNINFNLLEQNSCDVKITWKPEHADETDYYVVQRQNNPSENWISIGNVKAENSRIQNEYSYNDLLNSVTDPTYRLISVGKKGEKYIHSSKRISLNCNSKFDKKFTTIATNELNIKLPEDLSNTSLMIYDITGKTYKTTVHKSSGNYSINTSNLPSGIYILRIANQHIQKNIKFFVTPK